MPRYALKWIKTAIRNQITENEKFLIWHSNCVWARASLYFCEEIKNNRMYYIEVMRSNSIPELKKYADKIYKGKEVPKVVKPKGWSTYSRLVREKQDDFVIWSIEH